MAQLKNRQHERFCRLYIKTFNGAASWRDVRGGKGRPTHSDRTQASRLLTRADINARVAELIEERNQALAVDAQWVLQQLVEMASADPADLYDDEGNLKPIDELPVGLRRALTGVKVNTTQLGEDSEAASTTTEVRWTKLTEVLQLIGRHVDVQAFRDRVEHEGKLTLEQLVEQSMRKDQEEA